MGLPDRFAITRAAEATTMQPELCPIRCRLSGARPAFIKPSARASPGIRPGARSGRGTDPAWSWRSSPNLER